MELKDCKVLPGVVIDVDDPKYIGRVKADCPGIFDSSIMNKEGLPWIYPFSMSGYQRFSKLINGSKIWIIMNNEYTEFWYLPMFELNDDSKDIISKEDGDYEEAEILLSRNLGDNSVYIYYSPSQGIMLKNSENTFINVTSDNKIEIKAGDGNIVIKNNKVYMGQGDNYRPAVKYDELKKILEGVRNGLMSASAGLVPYCAAAKVGVDQAVNALSNLSSIASDNVFIN